MRSRRGSPGSTTTCCASTGSIGVRHAPPSSARCSGTARSSARATPRRRSWSRPCSTRSRPVASTSAAPPRDQSPSDGVEAPYLQLVLERLWLEESGAGASELRLETLRRLGGAGSIVRDHVFGTLERLPPDAQDAAATVVRLLVTPSGAKVSHTAADLAEYTGLDAASLRPLLDTLVHERIVRAVDGVDGGSTRYEIFHDALAEPLLAWRSGYEVERERVAAHRQRRRLLALVAAAFCALLVVGAVAVFALVERGTARTQARSAHARELAADALAGLQSDPAASLALALRAADLLPGAQTENVLRTSLLAMRERRVIRVGGDVVNASFAPAGGRLLVASSNGTLRLYEGNGIRSAGAAAAACADRRGLESRRPTLRNGRDGRSRDGAGARAPAGRSARCRPAARSRPSTSRDSELFVGSGARVRIVPDSGGPVPQLPHAGRRRVAGCEPERAAGRGGDETSGPRRDPHHRRADRAGANDASGARDRSPAVQRRRAPAGDRQHRRHGAPLERGDRTAAAPPPPAGTCPRADLLARRHRARLVERRRQRGRLGCAHRRADAAPRRIDGHRREQRVQPRWKGRSRSRPAIASRASTARRTAVCSRRSPVTPTRSRASATTRADA